MSVGNPRIELLVRNPQCTGCKMHTQAEGKDRCVTAQGNHEADVLVVTKNPLGPKSGKELHTYLDRAGFNVDELAYTGVIKCLVWDLSPSKSDLKACKEYLDKEIEAIRPKWILALGNEALQATAGKSGIMKHRGIVYERKDGVKVMATIAPAMVHRNPGQKGGFEADLRYFHRLVYQADTSNMLPDKHVDYHVVDTKDELYNMLEKIDFATHAAFDIESTGFVEFDLPSNPNPRIVSLSVTLEWVAPDTLETHTDVFALPLFHPQSVWRSSWQKVLRLVMRKLKRVPRRIAHNGKFDCRWLNKFGGTDISLTFDTMIAAHVLDENRPKGLKPLARQLLGVPPWDMSTKDLLNEPLADVLWYNALDTWHTMGLYRIFRDQLKEQPRKARLFQYILMPASNELTHVEQEGVWVDADKMNKHWAEAQTKLDNIDRQLMEWVPEDHGFKKVNFNPSNFLRWFLFDHLGLPILARGKDKEDGRPGDPSCSESVMLHLRDDPGHPVIDLLLERTKWQKYTSAFFSSYAEQLDESSRIHTTFKVTGTVTGRLSSGKVDEDKVTAKRQIRGVNLQQVPRDDFVRGIFGAPPGSYFVEFDYSQIELRVAAYLAQEPTMLHLYATGQDIHMAMAMRMTGKPAHLVTKEERKKAKAVNFGFLYGMSWRKFIETAFNNYGVVVSEEEAKMSRRSFFDQFPKLLRWHAQQRAFAHKHGYVVSPIGRVRNLPDIYSKARDVVNEAERQAINSPVQAFASDMCLWSMVLNSRKFRKLGLKAHPIGTVHDAVNYEIPADEMKVALPIIKNTMENLPLKKAFGVELNVPIVADCKVGTRWGGAIELESDQVYNWDPSILEAS